MKRIIVLLLCALPVVGMAADGVKEINPACVSAGCFAGDAPGFPVEITESGSFLLTGDLDLRSVPGAEDISAIQVNAPRVSIDLNGYSIIGPTVCSGSPLTCSPLGTGAGVVGSVLDEDLRIKNGFIQGMGQNGIVCAASCTVDNVSARSNGEFGLSAGTVTNSIAVENGVVGIGATGLIANSTAIGNRFTGMFAARGTISNARVRGSGNNGVICQTCNLIDSMIEDNGGFGVLFVESNNAYGGNVITDNGAGSVDFLAGAAAIQTKINVCGSSPC